MLALTEEAMTALNPKIRVELFGQELNGESFGICKSDMLGGRPRSAYCQRRFGPGCGPSPETGGVVQLVEIFAHRSRDLARIVPTLRRRRIFRAPRYARIGLDDARIRGERLAADETGAKAGLQHTLEHHTEGIALAESPMSRLGETGAFGNLAREAKPAEPV
jgi:hypothetical protein